MAELGGLLLALDPGHGGSDRGLGTTGGLTEASWTLRVTELLRERCEALGATVIMTRTDDTFVPQLLRTALIHEIRPDIVISLHLGESLSQSTGTVRIGYRWWQTKTARPLRGHLLYALERALPLQPERSTHTHTRSTLCRVPLTPVHTSLIAITAFPPETSLEANTCEPPLWADALAEGLQLYCRNRSGNRRVGESITMEPSVAPIHPPEAGGATATSTEKPTPSPLPLMPGVRMPLAGAPPRIPVNYYPTSNAPTETATRSGKQRRHI